MSDLENNSINPLFTSIDQELNALVSNIKILEAVKPLNYLQEKERFFANQFSSEPAFVYRQHDIDPFALKRGLFNLPLEKIQDEDLYQLYLAVIDSYVDKIDQFKSIGSSEFLYDSLRYYGEPSEKDIHNAQFILHLPESPDEDSSALLDAADIKDVMHKMGSRENYKWEMELDDNMVGTALVSGTRVRINSRAKLTQTDAMALAHHELGVHLVTSLNGNKQPLRILSLGCPINTTTQEGLAILSEYLSGNLTMRRLKTLALRVIAVKSMIEDKNFRTTFLLLKETYRIDDEQAYVITARAYRGGGYTKDYLYLKGFRLILNAYEHEPNFNNLLSGKASLEYLPLITRLIDKQLLVAPHFITPAFKAPVENNAVNTFITHAIR
ncbi:flavohemoglobin expression-modulating QEGLA motif protein [Psychromonas sp.]|uniref:flavohemoglobin expression-modulating QEGLA motif protein n=1 Tax=Psychromonas sp. TaxID=1884585 RepID=UPI0035658421